MSYTSQYNLNIRLSALEARINALVPVPPGYAYDLVSVLGVGNNAGTFDIDMNNNDILNCNDLDVVTINGAAYPPVVPADTLQAVLTAGNSATGTMATITLNDTDVGNIANPILSLQNSNATGSVALECYKNKPTAGVNGDVLFTQSVFGKDSGNAKQEFTRINHTIRDGTAGVEDGSIEFGCFVNGAVNTFLQINGNENEVNILRPLDMTGNAVRTSTLNLTLDALSSTGTGDVIITPKTNLRVGKTMLTNEKIQNLNSASASSVDFASLPSNKFNITKDSVELSWNDGGSNQSQLILNNDLATLNNSISQVYQSASGNIQTILQSVPSVHRFQQLDFINGRQSELSPAELELVNTAAGTTAFLNNNFGPYNNEFYLSANDTTTPLATQVKISNNPLNQYLALINNNSGTSNAKTLTLINETSVSPSLSWVNNIDSIPFNITSNQDLNIGATNNLDITTAIGDLDISSANDVNIIANAGDVNLNTGSNLTMTINNDWTLTGSSIISGTAGVSSGQYLRIFINGTPYKIQLLDDV